MQYLSISNRSTIYSILILCPQTAGAERASLFLIGKCVDGGESTDKLEVRKKSYTKSLCVVGRRDRGAGNNLCIEDACLI